MPRSTVIIPADYPPLVSASPVLAELDRFADFELFTDRPQSADEIVQRLHNADILLNSRGSLAFPESLLKRLPRLQMIAVCGIGYDSIHLPTATQQGIVVCNVPGKTAAVVAEHALALMLSTARRITWMHQSMQSGGWSAELSQAMAGRTIGVIGTGHIGCRMLQLCRAIGMQPVAWSLHPDQQKAAEFQFDYVPLETLLRESDVVSLHTRLSPATQHLINADRLHTMKPTAILINTARGAIVDTQALLDALNNGKLFGAGLDVYDMEPLPADHPLRSNPRVVLTPHSADTTQEAIDLLTAGCIDNIRAFLAGAPQNVVNPEVLATE